MKRLFIRVAFVAAAVSAAVAAASCRGDPTSSLRGGPKSLDVQPLVMFVDEGATKPVSVIVRDEQLNPVVAQVAAATLNPIVATVTVDTSAPYPDSSKRTFDIKGAGLGTTA